MVELKSFKTEIFFTLPINLGVICLVCTAMITDQWVSGKGSFVNGGTGSLTYNYGLFSGRKQSNIAGSPQKFGLSVICKGSKCMYSCANDPKADVEDILSTCPYTRESGDAILCSENTRQVKADCNNTDETYESGSRKEEQFMMSHSSWGATVAFLVIGVVFTLVASVMGGLNAFSNPIEMIVGVHGLLIWNSVAAFCYFLTVCIWGGEYDQNLKKAAPISDIMRQGNNDEWSTKGQSALGYSFWLIFVCFIFHLINDASVAFYIRKKYKPKKRVVNMENEKVPDNVILF